MYLTKKQKESTYKARLIIEIIEKEKKNVLEVLDE